MFVAAILFVGFMLLLFTFRIYHICEKIEKETWGRIKRLELEVFK